MEATTIKVDGLTRDRLKALAAERGCTIGDLVAGLADGTPTRAELRARADAAAAYLKQHLVADLGPEDRAAGEALWQAIAGGSSPSSLGPGLARWVG